MSNPLVGGGPVRAKVLDDMHTMSGNVFLVFLVLLSAYVSRIPDSILIKFRSIYYTIGGLFFIVGITTAYGWVHGILAALAFALIVSRSSRQAEGFMEYVPAMLFGDSDGTTIIDNSHRWLSEKVLGNNPKLIRDKEVKTSAVQDMSETNKGSHSSR
jgi:hypothetical protein